MARPPKSKDYPTLRNYLSSKRLECYEEIEEIRERINVGEAYSTDSLNLTVKRAELNLILDLIKLCEERNYY